MSTRLRACTRCDAPTMSARGASRLLRNAALSALWRQARGSYDYSCSNNKLKALNDVAEAGAAAVPGGVAGAGEENVLQFCSAPSAFAPQHHVEIWLQYVVLQDIPAAS